MQSFQNKNRVFFKKEQYNQKKTKTDLQLNHNWSTLSPETNSDIVPCDIDWVTETS